MVRTYFAYHLTHVFGTFGLETYYTNSEKPREGDLVYVISGDKDPEVRGVDYFLEGFFRIRRRNAGSWSLSNVRGGIQTYIFRLSMEPVRRPDRPIAMEQASWYSRDEIHRYFSSGQNFNPLPTDPDYKSRLDELLAGYASNEADSLAEDLAELARDIPDRTERDVLTKARLGQGKFRADVVTAWGKGEVCTLTDLAVPELLVASHIKPWRDATHEERLDPMNGLLLAAHVDKLFDRFLLSFKESRSGFESVLHPRVHAAVRTLGIKAGMILKTERLNPRDESRFTAYMREHLRRHQDLVAKDRPSE